MPETKTYKEKVIDRQLHKAFSSLPPGTSPTAAVQGQGRAGPDGEAWSDD